MKPCLLALLGLLLPGIASAKQFEVFDGQFYNGKYYPMIDIIEWGEQHGNPPHMEFHIHSKTKPIEVSAVPGEKNGKPVLWLMYDLVFRGERICRHVVAPAHFKEGMKLYSYKDSSDPDYENIFVSSYPMKGARLVEYRMPEYQPCADEHASNKPDAAPAARMPASTGSATPVPADSGKKEGKGIGVDYENNAVPFSF